MAKGRANGEGTVRKRADGRWEGRIVIGHKEDGAPLFKSVFAASQKELMPKCACLMALANVLRLVTIISITNHKMNSDPYGSIFWNCLFNRQVPYQE